MNSKNRLKVFMGLESGCNVEEGEYDLFISEIMSGWFGDRDFDLVAECISQAIYDGDIKGLPDAGVVEFILQESGERQGWDWVPWYEIASGPIEIICDDSEEHIEAEGTSWNP